MKDLVFYTVLSCVQIPLIVCVAYFLIVNRKTPDREGWHIEGFHIIVALNVFVYAAIIFWNYAYFMTTHFVFPQSFFVPMIITVCCGLSSFFAYRVFAIGTADKHKATQDSAKEAFLVIVIYAVAIVAYAWWSFNYHLVIK